MMQGEKQFFGWRVVGGAFVLAIFGWGLGFYGTPVYLHAVREARGWSIEVVSAAVTVHYLCGALVVARLPKLYQRFGLPNIARVGVVALVLGLYGWSQAEAPWQLFLATILSGCGWVTMAAAAINALLAPWFVRQRPKALSTAYNGASFGGIIFSPLWVLLIGQFGFAKATLIIGVVAILIIWWLSFAVFSVTPAMLGQQPDGADAPASPVAAGAVVHAPRLEGGALWRDIKFRTLAMGMALGLFAQIGLLSHLFSLIVPALGEGGAGILTGLATASAIAGRTSFGWLMPEGADRRIAAAASYGIQILGILLLWFSAGQVPALIIAGVLLVGFGLGNATSLPPLIAQKEFAKEDMIRAVALVIALAQAAYAFAPAMFGLARSFGMRANSPLSEVAMVCAFAVLIKLCAIVALLYGRRARERA
ncbi:MAG: MFS transporter [Rhabdaerophilum sp.]